MRKDPNEIVDELVPDDQITGGGKVSSAINKLSSLQKREDEKKITWEGSSCGSPNLIYDKDTDEIIIKWWGAVTPWPSVSKVKEFVQELQEMVKEAESL